MHEEEKTVKASIQQSSGLLLLGSVFLLAAKPVFFSLIMLTGLFVFLRSEKVYPARLLQVANLVTLGRLLLTILLPAVATQFSLPALGLACLFLFLLDGVDGFMARWFSQSSKLGAFLDEESDVVFVMVISFLIYWSSPKLSFFLLVPGYIRPVFVILFKKLRNRYDIHFPEARTIYFIAMLCIISTFFVPGSWHYFPFVAGTLLLAISFTIELAKLTMARYKSGKSFSYR